MQTHELVSHPEFPANEVSRITVRWSDLRDGRVMLRFRVDGCGALVVPAFRGKGRGDELWTRTCFELFLHDGEGRYREFNFSPSQQWAAYGFKGYRARTDDYEPVFHPEIQSERGLAIFTATVFLSGRDIGAAKSAALSAVIEEEGGRFSYWALKHGGDKPDFHDPACFRIALAAAKTS